MQEWLIVDGYNIIGAWPWLTELAERDFEFARDKLRDQLMNHCGFTGQQLVLVFDAHQIRKNETVQELTLGKGRRKRPVGIVVYTRKSETADNWIERFVREHEGERMTVASSDRLVQVLTFAYATRLSARELEQELAKSAKALAERTGRGHKKQHELEARLEKGAFAALDSWRKER